MALFDIISVYTSGLQAVTMQPFLETGQLNFFETRCTSVTCKYAHHVLKSMVYHVKHQGNGKDRDES